MQYLADIISEQINKLKTTPKNILWQHTVKLGKNFNWNRLTNHFAKEDGFTLLESQEEQTSTTNKYSGIFLKPLEKVVSELTSNNEILSYRTIYLADVDDTISNATKDLAPIKNFKEIKDLEGIKDLDRIENFDNIEVLSDPLLYIENSLQQFQKIRNENITENTIENITKKVVKNTTNNTESMFAGLGYVGMISYDYQHFLPKGQLQPLRLDKRIGLPLLHFCFFANAIIFDKELCTITIYGIDNFGYSKATIQDIIAKYTKNTEFPKCLEYTENLDFIKCAKTNNNQTQVQVVPSKQEPLDLYAIPHNTESSVNSIDCIEKTMDCVKKSMDYIEHTSKEKYLQDLNKIHQAIYAGDIYLLNYTTRMDLKLCAKPWDLFQKLRIQNPAPFAAYLSDKDWAVVSSSPELFIQVNDKHIKTKPIKGTISKTKDPKINQQHIKELQESIKERAELNMIVDLERNDLGKICKTGTVKVPEIFKIEEYPTLYHMVSTVEGQLKDNVGFSTVIKSMFPGGSITGTPKLSAMRHIAKFESTPRELYTGSIGYIGINGNINFNIVIRTIICKDQKAYISTGGGITWDSIPEEEYKEVFLKAKALKKVIN